VTKLSKYLTSANKNIEILFYHFQPPPPSFG